MKVLIHRRKAGSIEKIIMRIPLLFLTQDSRKLIVKKDTNNNRSIQVNAYQT